MSSDPTSLSLVFPFDFIRTKVDVPELAGACEGDATITYVTKDYPDWAPFYLRTSFVDNQPHGKATLFHNTRILMEAEYKYGSLYLKGQKCPNGILLDPSTGCHIVKKEFDEHIDYTYGKLLPENGTKAILEEAAEEWSEQNSSEEESESDEESEDEVYMDDVIVNTPEANSIKKVVHLVNWMINTINECSFEIVHAKTCDLWYIYRMAMTNNYLLVIKVHGDLPNGYGLLYSENTMQLQNVVLFKNGKAIKCYSVDSPKGKQKEVSVLDLSDEGHRWEGEIRNSQPNGYGQFYNELNELMYEGHLVNGIAQGLGRSYYPDTGVPSYNGMWRNGQRCGIGTSYDREGKVTGHGLFVNDSFVKHIKYKYSVRSMVLTRESYSLLVKTMYINNRVSDSLTISNYPYLQALFFNIPGTKCMDVLLKNLHSLRKVVFARTKQDYNSTKSLVIRSCPNIEEIWMSVQMETGIVRVERSNKPGSEYFNRTMNEIEIEDHFVLEELKEMGWKPVPDAPPDDYFYYHVDDVYIWNTNWEQKECHYAPSHYYRLCNKYGSTYCTSIRIRLPNSDSVRTLEKTKQAIELTHDYCGYWKHSIVCCILQLKTAVCFSFHIFMPSGIKKYDVYRKAIDGLQVKTSVGGLSEISVYFLNLSFDHIIHYYYMSYIDANISFHRS